MQDKGARRARICVLAVSVYRIRVFASVSVLFDKGAQGAM